MSKNNFNKTGKFLEVAIAILFVLIGVGLRMIPHVPNFAPIAAIALFSGVYLSKKIALIVPLAAMAISDVFLGLYDPKLMAVVYGSFILITLMGFWLKNHKKWSVIAGGSLVGSFIFFFLTNFAVWAFTPWYAKTISGIYQCYLMALPFFRNTLIGDLFYAMAFFGAYELAVFGLKKIKILSISPAYIK